MDVRKMAMTDAERTLRVQILQARLEKARAEKEQAILHQMMAEMAAEEARLDFRMRSQAREQSAKEYMEDMRLKRQAARPSRFLGAFVFQDDEIGKWVCAYDGVTAYGESPEMACDNFDQLWVFGR
jgi:hypothetical protein